MEEAPTLRLEITQGPRAGEALEFKSSKKVGIGRLVRGNAVQIKDNGISSKHLVIEFVSGKWLITDLDSSNGTIVNDEPLDPLVPTPLRDGDVVKIGENTSIHVKFEVRVESESVFFRESNLRRNPRRRAAVKDVLGLTQGRVTEGSVGVDLEEKKVLQGGDVGESVAQKRKRKAAAKRNDLKNVDDSGAELQVAEEDVEKKDSVVETGRRGGRSKRGRRGAAKKDLNKVDDDIVVEDSDAKVEKENRVVETGRRGDRPKRVKAGAESILAGENCNEEWKGEGQEVKKTRGGRGGARRGRALKERNGENDFAAAEDKVKANVADASRGERGSLRNSRALNKESTEDESAMVDGNCDQLLQSVPLEDGIKKQTRGQTKRAQVADKEVMKEVTAEKEITNSGFETQIDSVNIKKEKISICPSVVLENQVSRLESLEPLENLGVENAIGSDIFEPLEAAGIQLAIQENEDVSRSQREMEIENSGNEILPTTLNIKQEKRSLPPSVVIPQDLCLKRNEVEPADGRCSESEDLMQIDDGLSMKVIDTARLETHESSEPAGVHSAVAVNAETKDSVRQICEGTSAEPELLGSQTEGHHKLKLEEMTLGQWFDYLELYLPKQIHDSTEKMIASMIEKSIRFQEYVSQQQKEKEKVQARPGT